jgi:hypothetical protein
VGRHFSCVVPIEVIAREVGVRRADLRQGELWEAKNALVTPCRIPSVVNPVQGSRDR